MPVSDATIRSAKNFCAKYGCGFKFSTFEARVEEFTFLRPNGGWIDFYKMTFEQLYKNAFERVAVGDRDSLDGEAMLDDYEYTLIRPYVHERDGEIKHVPYAGMNRTERLEYLYNLTKKSPSNMVEIYTEKYKNGETSPYKMRELAEKTLSIARDQRERYVEVASLALALESVNKSRSAIWRAFHPSKNNAERKGAMLIKQRLINATVGGEQFYNDVAESALDTFECYERISLSLEQSMVYAGEEQMRAHRMNDAVRKSSRVDDFTLHSGMAAIRIEGQDTIY